MEIDSLKAAFTFLAGLLLFFIFFPILNIFAEQFSIHLDVFIQTLTETATLKSVGVTVFAALLSVIVAFVFGVPLAYLLAREDFRGKGFVEGIVDLPMAIPHVVAGVALLAVLGSGGIIGGATEPLLQFQGTFLGIVAAMTFVSAPFLINSAREGFQNVNPRLENVARNLGASKWQAFQEIAFPLAFPHIFTGAVMSWARAISEFSAIIILVGFYPTITSGLIWIRFNSVGLVNAMSVATVLLLIVLPTFIILRFLRGKLFDNY